MLIGTFYEKTGIIYLWPFLDTFFDKQLLYGVLELVGVRCYTFGGKFINLVWPDYHGISWWLLPTVDREIINLRRVFIVHFTERMEWYYDRDRELWEASVYLVLVFILWCVWPYYFIIISEKLCFWITNRIRISKW